MKIILISDISGLGKKGEIKEVNPGYARNFLLREKKAFLATSSNIAYYEQKKKIEEKNLKKQKKDAEELSEKISKLTINIPAKTGEGSRLFGSITSQDIVDALRENKIEIDKKMIVLEEPIKVLGMYTIEIKLAMDVVSKLKLLVVRA